MYHGRLSAARSKRFPMRKIPAAMLLTVIAGSAAAQSDTDVVELGPIRVTSAAGFEQKITEAPASISVITQEALQQKRYTDLARARPGDSTSVSAACPANIPLS